MNPIQLKQLSELIQKASDMFPELLQQIRRADEIIKSEQPKKEVLFKTEDGIEITDGDTFYTVGKSFAVNHNVSIDKRGFYDEEDFNKYQSGKSDVKYFSTQEIAETYILLNQPLLSVNETAKKFSIWAWGKCIPSEVAELEQFMIRGLKFIAQQKLNNK